jgi:nucleotide-binding universal stress UspA family protein
MYTKVLYPTDFSDCAARALSAIVKLKEAGAQEVIILHVVDVHRCETALIGTSWVKAPPAQYLETLKQELTAIATDESEEVKQKIELAGMRAMIRIITGIPFREILKTADEEHVDLIVMGSHGKSNIREMLLGSVSEKVIRKARQHVLAIKRDNGEKG